VRDISKDYFVTNHESNYRPGDDITLWIKFVDATANKLGFQLYNPSTVRLPSINIVSSKPTVYFEDLSEGDEVEGIVTKYSKFSLDVDINCRLKETSRPIFGYLHKRKIKITKSLTQGKNFNNLKPWEMLPQGTVVVAWVYELDEDRKRISLTTYPPNEWDIKLPPRQRDVEDSGEFRDDDDDEEMGGEVRAANLRALQRTLMLNGQADEDEDDDDGEALFDYSDDDEDDDEDADDLSDDDDGSIDDSYAYTQSDEDVEFDVDDNDDNDDEDNVGGEDLTQSEIDAIVQERKKDEQESANYE